MKILHKTKKISELIKLRSEIHLNPAWQRGQVWTITKQALLIDSILRRYDIPMIYLRDCGSKSPYKYEVVDGQQRLRSLWDFIDDKYALSKEFEQVGEHNIAGKKYNDLPKTLQDRITNFQIVVAFVKDAREPEISHLFSRMQMGVSLNPPELRNAVQTGLRHAVDGIARLHPFFKESRIPSIRFKHQDYLAHAISLCIHSGKRDLKARQLMDDYRHITDSNVYVPVMKDADEILSCLEKVNIKCSKRITQKWIFVDLFYLLYQHKQKLKTISVRALTDTYVEFDRRRLEHTAEPEKLLADKHSKRNVDLYDYILAFKISGGEKKNVAQRNNVLRREFKKVFGR